jgi:hypothetical protein
MDVLQRAELVLDAGDGVRVVVQDRLQRDPLVALEVVRLVHDPHASFADATDHLEARRQCEPNEGHEGPFQYRTRCLILRGAHMLRFSSPCRPLGRSDLEVSGTGVRVRSGAGRSPLNLKLAEAEMRKLDEMSRRFM